MEVLLFTEEFWLSIILFGGIGAPVLIALLYEAREMHRLRTEAFKESIEGKAYKEAQFVRGLSEQEKKILQNKSSHLSNVSVRPFVYFIVLFTLTAGFLIFVDAVSHPSYAYHDWSLFIKYGVIVGISLLVPAVFLFYVLQKEKEFYKDMKVGVRRVQGRYNLVFRYENSTEVRNRIIFSVRNNQFHIRMKDEDDLENFFNHQIFETLVNLEEGSEVVVEYSPFSKTVWSVERVEGK